jgi:lysophospholipase L1-like esterase
MRVLVFGDSITQGYWDINGGWVERIRKHYDSLQASDLQGRDEPTVFNLGISADNSADILARIEPETIARTRHGNLPVIIIQIGVNDSSVDKTTEQTGNALSLQEYEKNLRAIIERATPISSKLIFVGLSACDETRTTPVSWGDFYYTNTAIKEYEDKMKEIATENDIAFIPIFDIFLKTLNEDNDLLPDGLHPNADGHELMRSLILEKLDPILKN